MADTNHTGRRKVYFPKYEYKRCLLYSYLGKYEYERHLAINDSLWTKPIPALPVCSALPKISILRASSTMEQFLSLPKLQLKSRCLTGNQNQLVEVCWCWDPALWRCSDDCHAEESVHWVKQYEIFLGHPPWISTLLWEHTNLRLKCWVFIH